MSSKAHSTNGGSSGSNGNGGSGMSLKLSDAYPVNSILELTLSPTDETVQGLVYCTDEISNSIVLKKSLNYTTLASEIRVINASCIKAKKVIKAQAPKAKGEGGDGNGNGGDEEELALPLPNNVTKKSIEEREKRAIMLAEESFKHINQQVSFNSLIVRSEESIIRPKRRKEFHLHAAFFDVK